MLGHSVYFDEKSDVLAGFNTIKCELLIFW